MGQAAKIFTTRALCGKGKIIETTSVLNPIAVKTIGLIIAGVLISLALWQFQSLRQALTTIDGNRRLARRDRLFLRRQTLRRLQMHVLLGLSGIGMLVGIYVPPLIYPLIWTAAWCLVIFLLAWSTLLALIDYCSIRLHFSASLQKQDAEKLNLEYQLKCIREALAKEKADAQRQNSEPNPSSATTPDKEQTNRDSSSEK